MSDITRAQMESFTGFAPRPRRQGKKFLTDDMIALTVRLIAA